MKIKAIYDNGGKTLDRYTIVTNVKTVKPSGTYYDCICSSEHGLGVFMWGDCMLGKHLGNKIKLEDLDETLQKMIENALKD